MIRKLKPEEKKALERKLKESGVDLERGKPIKIELTDEKKEELKKLIAESEEERLKRIDKVLKSRG